ncbi:MAG TPA: DPP IV N-terminal domain-containing protein, partial [Thermoanaerobaculia bacterium]|nr:DPP IV N-terminal domain-containing protein [Thermoanaerobaculia bacterium]
MRVRLGPVLLASLSVALAGPLPAWAAAKKPLTLEAITADPPLVSRGAADASWRDASHLTFTLPDEYRHDEPSPLFEVDAKTGKRIKLIEPLAIQPRTIPEKTLPFTGASWSPDGRTLLLSGDKDLWLYGLERKDLRRVTRDENEEDAASFSPDGRLVAFVRKNDLYVLDVSSGKETRLTTTGTETKLNGVLDWVYEEELANRKSRKSYAFSPDSASIVYLSLDDSHVPEYPIVDYV